MSSEQADRLDCLVLNAGGTYLANKDEAEAWVERVASDKGRRPDLVFAQEVPSERWLDIWLAHGYRQIRGYARGWKVRSIILTLLPSDTCSELSHVRVPELEYHGEYVAAAELPGWGTGDSALVLFSVHASPNPTTSEYLDRYPQPDRILRRGGGADPRYAGQLFDADVVLETVSRYGPAVLACGDLNEARGWDDEHPGHTWGAEYFGTRDDEGELVGGSVQKRGLVDVPLSDDGSEVITRRAVGHPRLQLDHILTSPQVVGRIENVEVDPDWTAENEAARGLADHAPIRFALVGLGRRRPRDTRRRVSNPPRPPTARTPAVFGPTSRRDTPRHAVAVGRHAARLLRRAETGW